MNRDQERVTNLERDVEWSSRCVSHAKKIIDEVLATESLFEGRKRDLLVFRAERVLVVARVRRAGFARSYGHDITFRTRRPQPGYQSELDAIRSGRGDFMVYGFARDDGRIFRWCVVSLERLREKLITWGDELLRGRTKNHDGSSEFRWLDARDIRVRPCVVATSDRFFDDDERSSQDDRRFGKD